MIDELIAHGMVIIPAMLVLAIGYVVFGRRRET